MNLYYIVMDISIDNNYFILYKSIKLLLNILLNYVFLTYILYTDFSINEKILFIITFSTVIFYILDYNFPFCNVIVSSK
jgi:hypothetical protein